MAATSPSEARGAACLAALMTLAVAIPSPTHADGSMSAAASSALASTRVVLTRPQNAAEPSWVRAPLFDEAPAPPELDLFVRATHHNASIYLYARDEPVELGIARRGTVLRARASRRAGGCAGSWLSLAGRGFVCTTRGFEMLSERPERAETPRPPSLDAPLPYRYGRVSSRAAYRFSELPTSQELERLADGARLPGVAERLDGDYFVAIDGEVSHDGRSYVRTIAGEYVDASVIVETAHTELRGAMLGAGRRLPLAFVIDPGVETFRVTPEGLEPFGVAEKYARFAVAGTLERQGEAFVVGPGDVALARTSIRIARRAARPSGVGPEERWVNVDVAEQTLVAYEGDRPVFATLVSSGKEGYDTPAGTFRIRHKYVSITMSGAVPGEDVYDVEEVPWTMYYDGSYALHGAYWHDTFGRVRSHGCTNMSPVDARWLFRFTSPKLPRGWHGIRANGTVVVVSNDEPDVPF